MALLPKPPSPGHRVGSISCPTPGPHTPPARPPLREGASQKDEGQSREVALPRALAQLCTIQEKTRPC